MRLLVDIETAKGSIKMTNTIICNKCAAPLWEAGIPDHPATPEYFTAEHKWGKRSLYPNQTHSFHLCQGCYVSMIENYFTRRATATK